MKNIVLNYSRRNVMFSSLLAVSIACLVLFSGKKKSRILIKEALSVEEIHQIRILCKDALAEMPSLDDWDSLMTSLDFSREQDALALLFVKRDLLQMLSKEELSKEEFEAGIRRYEETCDELSRLLSTEKGHTFSEDLFKLTSVNHSIKLGLKGRLIANGLRMNK